MPRRNVRRKRRVYKKYETFAGARIPDKYHLKMQELIDEGLFQSKSEIIRHCILQTLFTIKVN